VAVTSFKANLFQIHDIDAERVTSTTGLRSRFKIG